MDVPSQLAIVSSVSGTPAVSLIIPYYNAHETIRDTLVSVLSGSQVPAEIVIADDGSDEPSRDFLDDTVQALGSKETIVVRTPQNLGGGAARNHAISKTHHPWIFCLDSDNLLGVGTLRALLSAASSGDFQVYCPETLIYFHHSSQEITHAWRFPTRPLEIADFWRHAILPAASGNYLFSRLSWERSGGYPTKSGALDAWGFGLRQFSHGFAPKPVSGSYYFHRIIDGSYWSREASNSTKLNLLAESLILENLVAEPPSKLREFRKATRRKGWSSALVTPKFDDSARSFGGVINFAGIDLDDFNILNSELVSILNKSQKPPLAASDSA